MRSDLHAHSPFGELMKTTILGGDARREGVGFVYEMGEPFTNRMGNVAGGMVASMLDSITGLTALTILEEDLFAVHVHLAVDYLRPTPAGRVEGRGRLIRREDREIETEGELLDAEGRVLARARAVLRIVRKPARS